MRKFLVTMMFGLLLAISGSAKAYYYDFGLLGIPDLKISPSVSVPACLACGVDQFDFDLAAPATLSAGAFNVAPYVGFPAYAFPTFMAVLIPGGVAPLSVPGPLLPAGIPFVPSPDGQQLDIVPSVNLAAGHYSILVTGSTGAFGGMYAVSVATLPVPEPSSYIMLLAGLGLVAGVMRKRRRNA